MPAAWTVVEELGPEDRRAVATLLAAAEAQSRDEALTEDRRERLERDEGVRHALRREDGRLTGYAVLVDDDVLGAEPALGSLDDGLVALLEQQARPVRLLVRPAPTSLVAGLEARGWHQVRSLLRLRRALPADPPPPTDLAMRAFRPGRDEAAWLAENNAAFAGHPTQSHMTLQTLAAREAEPWFDPDGFLLFFDGATLVASCWTKVHPCEDGDVGEIYVISVDPSAQRRGLGRLAVLAGLAHLSSRGIEHAELFVEDDNVRAITLYVALGFAEEARVAELRFDPR